MSLIQKLIGKKKKKPTKADQTIKVNNAIQKLRDQVTLLNKRKTHSEKQIANYNKAAQKCLKSNNRKGALAKIKLRKQVEKRVETLDNQIFNLEVQIMALDESLMNRNMLNAMQTARNALQIDNPDDMLDTVEQTQEDIQEALDLQQEFNDLMGTPLINYDEDELEQELAELNDELLDDGLLYGNKNINKNINIKLEQKEDEVEEEEEEEEKKKNDDIVDDEYMKLKRFGNIEIGILTKSIGGKSLDDIILLKDIIIQFQTVIKQQARIKLIKSFAAKKKKDRKS
eukprot:31677_1